MPADSLDPGGFTRLEPRHILRLLGGCQPKRSVFLQHETEMRPAIDSQMRREAQEKNREGKGRQRLLPNRLSQA